MLTLDAATVSRRHHVAPLLGKGSQQAANHGLKPPIFLPSTLQTAAPRAKSYVRLALFKDDVQRVAGSATRQLHPACGGFRDG